MIAHPSLVSVLQVVLDQQIHRRISASELSEKLVGVKGRPSNQVRVPVPLSDLGDLGLVIEAGVLERVEDVQRQHLEKKKTLLERGRTSRMSARAYL